MTLILLFCAFLQSYAAVQEDLSAHLPEEELEAFHSFSPKKSYTLKQLNKHAGYAHTLLKSRNDIPDGELGLEMDPTAKGFSFSEKLLCQAFFLMNKNYHFLNEVYPGKISVGEDKRKYSTSYPLLILSAKMFVANRKIAAKQQYTEWHSTFYSDTIDEMLAELEEDARKLNEDMLSFERRTSGMPKK